MIKIGRFKVGESKLFLRTSDNGMTRNGFKAKPLGQWNDAGEKWAGINNCRECGGFFGIDKDANRFGLLNRCMLELCEWRGGRVIIDGDKICVKSFRVLATNGNIPKELVEQAGGHLIRDGEVVESGKNHIAIDVVFKQTGGVCFMYGNSKNKQFGGDCYMGDNSINEQFDGYCWAFDCSENKQSGGTCYMFDHSKNKQSGGYCEMDDYSKNEQSGGDFSICSENVVLIDRRNNDDWPHNCHTAVCTVADNDDCR